MADGTYAVHPIYSSPWRRYSGTRSETAQRPPKPLKGHVRRCAPAAVRLASNRERRRKNSNGQRNRSRNAVAPGCTAMPGDLLPNYITHSNLPLTQADISMTDPSPNIEAPIGRIKTAFASCKLTKFTPVSICTTANTANMNSMLCIIETSATIREHSRIPGPLRHAPQPAAGRTPCLPLSPAEAAAVPFADPHAGAFKRGTAPPGALSCARFCTVKPG